MERDQCQFAVADHVVKSGRPKRSPIRPSVRRHSTWQLPRVRPTCHCGVGCLVAWPTLPTCPGVDLKGGCINAEPAGGRDWLEAPSIGSSPQPQPLLVPRADRSNESGLPVLRDELSILWYWVLSAPPGPDGRRRRQWSNGFKTKQQGGLKPRTVGHVHRALHRMLKQAVRWRLIALNPPSDLELPAVADEPMVTLPSSRPTRCWKRPGPGAGCTCSSCSGSPLARGLGSCWPCGGPISIWIRARSASDGPGGS
jgi:hypothetical protein